MNALLNYNWILYHIQLHVYFSFNFFDVFFFFLVFFSTLDKSNKSHPPHLLGSRGRVDGDWDVG